MIKSCTCSHDYQDSVYGSGKRVQNVVHGKSFPPGSTRCTVCGSSTKAVVAVKKSDAEQSAKKDKGKGKGKGGKPR